MKIDVKMIIRWFLKAILYTIIFWYYVLKKASENV